MGVRAVEQGRIDPADMAIGPPVDKVDAPVAGVAKDDIGRIDVRETFSLVEVAAGAADRAVRGLTGTTIRGRRVIARLDRER